MNQEEKLNGFLDGEVDAAERAEIEALLARDVDAKIRVERLRNNDDLVRAAFDAPMREDLPNRFLSAIDEGLERHAAIGAERAARRNDVRARPANENDPRWWPIGGALAASFAVGLVVASQLAPVSGDPIGSIALNEALNTTPSMRTVALKSGERVTPQLSFAQVNGGYCRQFKIASATKIHSALACKSIDRWTIEAMMPAEPMGSSQAGYATAQGPGSTQLESVIDTLRAGDPLDPAAENALIARRWNAGNRR